MGRTAHAFQGMLQIAKEIRASLSLSGNGVCSSSPQAWSKQGARAGGPRAAD